MKKLPPWVDRKKNEVKSRLRVLLAHLLKRCYVDLPDCYRGWQDTITEQRSELDVRLDTSPSLRCYIQEILPECWRYAYEQVASDYPPAGNPFGEDIDQLLRCRYWMLK